ncbi:MAG: hypothetical protein WC812_01805 [Candidatus Pacearchaeota archaeon]|jgi:cation:H+ antiporter
MWYLNLIIFLVALFVLIRSANYAVRYSSRFARAFHLSEFIVSFFIVSFISISPEATVGIISSINGTPEFGLGALLGSNVADLFLIFGIISLFSLKGIKVKSEILKEDLLYIILLAIPVILGFDGKFSKMDGVLLVLSGAIFLVTLSIKGKMFKKKNHHKKNSKWGKNLFLLILSLLFLVASAYFTVRFGVNFANDLRIPPFLVALTVVSIGSCLPELIFSLKAVRTNHDELALGDILGTVIIDATIILGVMALINPFNFSPSIIHSTGIILFIAGILVVSFLKSGKLLSKKEGILLLIFYIASLVIGFFINRGF